MSLKKPTFVIFDMDGTTVRHVNPRLLHALEWLDDQAFRCSRFMDWLLRRGGKGPVFLEIDGTAHKKKPKLIVHRVMHKLRRKSVEQIVEPCPGIYAVLDFIKSHNIPMALASNGLGKGYGHDVLEKFDLAPYFKATIFREDITKSKPNPESVLLAMQQSGFEPQASDVVWYVGDRHKDITAAVAAGKLLPCTIEPIAYAMNAALAVIKNNVGSDHIIMSHYDLYVRLMLLLGNPPEKKSETPGSKTLAA